MLRFSITWLVKWYSALELKKGYLHSQVTPTSAKIDTRKRELSMCLDLLDKIIEHYSPHNSVLLFLLKTIYFNTGYGDVSSDHIWRFIPKKLDNRVCYIMRCLLVNLRKKLILYQSITTITDSIWRENQLYFCTNCCYS